MVQVLSQDIGGIGLEYCQTGSENSSARTLTRGLVSFVGVLHAIPSAPSHAGPLLPCAPTLSSLHGSAPPSVPAFELCVSFGVCVRPSGQNRSPQITTKLRQQIKLYMDKEKAKRKGGMGTAQPQQVCTLRSAYTHGGWMGVGVVGGLVCGAVLDA